MDSPLSLCRSTDRHQQFFINYATEHIAISDSTAATLLSFGGMGLFMLGRLGGSWAMGLIRAERLLAILAIIATLATSVVVFVPNTLGFIALLVVYLCESIMFPTLFALTLPWSWCAHQNRFFSAHYEHCRRCCGSSLYGHCCRWSLHGFGLHHPPHLLHRHCCVTQ